MADTPYVRWQGLAITQMSVAVSLFSGLSIASLGFGFSLLRDDKFVLCDKLHGIFISSLALLLLSSIFSCSVVITRLLDFRLTARKSRKEQKPDYKRSLTIIGLGPDAYGKLTWGLFWLGCVSFFLGIVLLFGTIGIVYGSKLL